MKRLASIATYLCLLVPACGSSDDDKGSCQAAAACGGDVLGTWNLSGACYTVLHQPMLDFCPKATAELHVDDTDGSLIFDKDTFKLDIQLNSTVNLHLPASCLQDQGEKRECSDFDGALVAGQKLKCSTGGSGGCTCEFPFPAKLTQSGIYAVRGKQLEWGAEKSDYCVSGDRLSVQPGMQLQMGGMMTDANFVVQTTFTKQ